MSFRQVLALSGLLILSGCLYHAREHADATVAELVSHPYDVAPSTTPETSVPPPAPQASRQESQPTQPEANGTLQRGEADRTHSPSIAPQSKTESVSQKDVQTTALMQRAAETPALIPENRPRMEPKIPLEIPGSEAKPIGKFPMDEEAKQKAIQQLFPELPPLPTEPTAAEGPDGRPLTLSQLQEMAAANSPDLRQAAADVEAARGNMIQARTYPNPVAGWQVQPSNDNSTSGAQGPFIDQTIKFGGKLKLASAAAEMDLRNAELNLRRARNDLATRVRSSYYTLLVAKETVRLDRALARFTDQIFRLHVGLLQAGTVADYEPNALRAQAYVARLAHQQSIQAYIYAWKGIVATIGLRQLPLTQVDGRIDAVIPYYEYDKVLEHVLRNHTDLQVARNVFNKSKYNLQLAQLTPYPDVDVNMAFLNEYALAPKQFFNTVTIGFPFPIWDKNKGAIIAAESSMVRATEEPHRVEVTLTSALATAYQSYKANLQGLDYFRHYILPDQVRTYRGVLDARQFNPSVAFSDLYNAQQTLSQDVTTYLNILSSLWSSVVNVADLLQTDDLFQLAQPQEVPGLPDLEHLPIFPCCHPDSGSAGEVQPAYQSYQTGAKPTQPANDAVASLIRGGQSSERPQAEVAGKAVFASAPAPTSAPEREASQLPADNPAVIHAGTNP